VFFHGKETMIGTEAAVHEARAIGTNIGLPDGEVAVMIEDLSQKKIGQQVDPKTGEGINGNVVHIAIPHHMVCACGCNLLSYNRPDGQIVFIANFRGMTPRAISRSEHDSYSAYTHWALYECPQCERLLSNLIKDDYANFLWKHARRTS
jgi:hypothetical protein